MTKKTFTREELLDILDSDQVMLNEVVDTSRWSIIYNLVFRAEDKFYQTSYSVGSTEMQDERPWEDEETVDCTEVLPQEVIVKKWVPA